jgi:hypothetical protein
MGKKANITTASRATKLRGQGRSQAPAEGSKLGNEGMGTGAAELIPGRAQEDGVVKRKSFLNSVNSENSVIPSIASASVLIAKGINRIETEKGPPRVESFADFLMHQARVKEGASYVPYHFVGREALRGIVERLDLILASGESDASLAICGGAQFGKTVLMLNLLAYLVAVRFRNVGYYLPDDDLVSGLVDGKLRPDVLDRIPWLARLIAVGKTLSPTGRAVNRKGAFLCTDGERTALAFMRGLGKIPTSFSMDVVVQDEKDDLPEEHARFLAGRMTASNLRLSLLIGTQRYHGAGQNLAFTEGSQHVGLLACPGCGELWNPETVWPGVCRLAVEELASQAWPRLTAEGYFRFDAVLTGKQEEQEIHEEGRGKVFEGLNRTLVPSCISSASCFPFEKMPIPYSPGQRYALCCLDCGEKLDREHPQWHALAPEREAERKWSYRISQLLIPAIELEQIVAAWQQAIRDPDHMTVFCTDRLALPKSTTLALTPGVLEAARGDYLLEDLRSKNLDLRTAEAEASPSSKFSVLSSEFIRFGGLDMGDQCWFVARAIDAKAPHLARLLWAEAISAERVRARVPELFRELGLSVLCVDAGPLRDLSRDLVFLLNGLEEGVVPSSQEAGRNIYFNDSRRTPCDGSADGNPVARSATATLQWHAASETWRGVRCMAVEFTQREGQGLRHKLARTQDGRLYPLLAANRDETIDRVVQELLPPGVGDPRLIEHADGTAAAMPTQRFFLPRATDATRGVLDVYERHLLAGARREKSNDGKSLRYLDKCENHFLLATAYAALAEFLMPKRAADAPVMPGFRALPMTRPSGRLARSLVG